MFVVSFSREIYQFEEGAESPEVCLTGEGEIAQQAMVTLASPPLGSATGELLMVSHTTL